ncbi:hypothetical protein A2U01_0114494, partial [Trifolium medium]|nr:hypothetical protein [Trifolium medium]
VGRNCGVDVCLPLAQARRW